MSVLITPLKVWLEVLVDFNYSSCIGTCATAELGRCGGANDNAL